MPRKTPSTKADGVSDHRQDPSKPGVQIRNPGERSNAKGDHHGSGHSPDDFDVVNPEKQGVGIDRTPERVKPPSGRQ